MTEEYLEDIPSYVQVAEVMIETGQTRPFDVMFSVCDKYAQGPVDDGYANEVQHMAEVLISNSSPCWYCGEGYGDNRVEYFDGPPWPARYLHPTCWEKRRKLEKNQRTAP